MRCVSCGMTIRGKPIREEIGGRVYHYCCRDCLQEELCRRDKPLRKALRPRLQTTRSSSAAGREFQAREA